MNIKYHCMLLNPGVSKGPTPYVKLGLLETQGSNSKNRQNSIYHHLFISLVCKRPTSEIRMVKKI